MAFFGSSKWMAKAFTQKAMESFKNEHPENLVRNLSLFDLICVGVGATVGSGVFVLTGFVANQFAGPGVIISWMIAGIACTCSAMSYAELSCRIPSSGSAYSYVYLALGEWPAFITAWCLTLECGISGSAVARSWGVKLNDLIVNMHRSKDDQIFSEDNLGVNIYAGALQLVVVIIFLCGVDISKFTVNFFTVLKMILVLFIIVCGFMAFKLENVAVFAPMGVTGITRGATACFFGFVGYDAVCCMAFETVNPQRNIPLAIFGTIGLVTVFYCLASLALVGMTPYTQIDLQNGFSMAFRQNGMDTIGHIVAFGELFMLPIVVLVSFLAQPRLQLAMAIDGLLPASFGEVNQKGNLFKGILYGGILCTLVALLVPFSYLDDMVSAGVLFSFNLTNMSLIQIRCGRNFDEPKIAIDLFKHAKDCDSELDEETVPNVIHTTNSQNSSSTTDCNEYSLSYHNSGFFHRFHKCCRRLVTLPEVSSNRCTNLLLLFCFYSILTSSFLCNLPYASPHNKEEDTAAYAILTIIPGLGMIYTAINMFATCPEISSKEAAALQESHSNLSMLYSNGMVTPLRTTHSQRNTPSRGNVYETVSMTPLHIDGEDVTPPYQHNTPSAVEEGHGVTSVDRAHADTVVSNDTEEFDLDYYHVPFMPFIPLFGIFINFYLVCQLSTRGLVLIIGFVVLGSIVYFCYSMHHSVLNKKFANSHSIEELDHIYLTSGPLPQGTSFTPPRKGDVNIVYSAIVTDNATRMVHTDLLSTPPRSNYIPNGHATLASLPASGSRRRGYETVPNNENL